MLFSSDFACVLLKKGGKEEGLRLRETICPGSVAYWAWFVFFYCWGEENATVCHPVPPTVGILRSPLDKQFSPL